MAMLWERGRTDRKLLISTLISTLNLILTLILTLNLILTFAAIAGSRDRLNKSEASANPQAGQGLPRLG